MTNPREWLDWGDSSVLLDVVIEVRTTTAVRVRVRNQAEAEAHCRQLEQRARENNPNAYIGCGVVSVKATSDE